MGEKWPVRLVWFWLHVNHRVFLHAANLWLGTYGFTYSPKEGMLWIFFARMIRQLWLGSNPWSWVPEASMLTTRPPKPLGIHGQQCVNLKPYTEFLCFRTRWNRSAGFQKEPAMCKYGPINKTGQEHRFFTWFAWQGLLLHEPVLLKYES
jgi:hypothetical protein